MIGVGINKNAVLVKAEITPKGVLSIVFDEVQNITVERKSVFDDLQTASVENGGETARSLNIFPFKVPDGPKNEGKTVDEKVEMVSDDMKKVKYQLTQLLEQYMTLDAIKWDPYVGTGITGENYRDKFLDNDALGNVFTNYARQFITQVTPFIGNTAILLRVKLIRQSKDKHYATIPGRFLADNPWVDLMEIPDEQTKVKFTKWELQNGLNDGTPVPKSNADVMPTPAAVDAGASNVFGNR